MTERQERFATIVTGLILFLAGFSMGVLCQARQADAQARISGGTDDEQMIAAVVLVLRPDLAPFVTSVTFVPRASLLVNSALAAQNPHCRGQCVGESNVFTGEVRMAADFPWTVEQLAERTAHEYAHPAMYHICGLCTTDEAAVDACASDVRLCYAGARTGSASAGEREERR